MKARLAVILAVVVIGVGIIGTQIGFVSPALAGDGLAAATAVTILPGGTDEGTDEAKFVGNKKCKMCHKKEYESWLETKKAKTFDPLKPGSQAEAQPRSCQGLHEGRGMPGVSRYWIRQTRRVFQS